MTLRLTVDTVAWEGHLASVVASSPGLVPVVKGNGYGFGRALLMERAAAFADTVAVGTVHELDDTVPDGLDVVVLTPTLHPPTDLDQRPTGDGVGGPILTVSSAPHLDVLRDRPHRIIVKLASSMHRYGTTPDALDELVAATRDAGHEVVGVALHLPLSGSDAERLAETAEMLTHIDPGHEVWLSHLGADAVAALPDTHRYRLRLGTRLWHGDKSMLHLTAEVIEVRPVTAGDTAGYRGRRVPDDGTLVMIGAGTAHGVHPLMGADDAGTSPFHHRRRRLALLEAPHMHTSMVFVPAGEPVPTIGERVDVQRPLTTTTVDEIEWR